MIRPALLKGSLLLLVASPLALGIQACSFYDALMREECCCFKGTDTKGKWVKSEECEADPDTQCCAGAARFTCEQEFCGAPPKQVSFQGYTIAGDHKNSVASAVFVKDGGPRPLVLEARASRLNCAKLCKEDPNSPFCISSTAPPNLAQPLSSLRDKLTEKDSLTIPIAELQSMFSVPSDPCHRGALKQTINSLQNSGAEACILSANLRAGADPMAVRVSIPKDLSAERKKEAGALRYSFPSSAPAPELNFDNPEWQQDFGGSVHSVTVNGSILILETQQGCIALKIGG